MRRAFQRGRSEPPRRSRRVRIVPRPAQFYACEPPRCDRSNFLFPAPLKAETRGAALAWIKPDRRPCAAWNGNCLWLRELEALLEHRFT
jgi:hypothetical protein